MDGVAVTAFKDPAHDVTAPKAFGRGPKGVALCFVT
jgi:hypothetical protein